MFTKTSTRDLAGLPPAKLAGPSGTPSAAPVGLALPRRPRMIAPDPPAVRPPSISRFPGLLQPHSYVTLGGIAL